MLWQGRTEALVEENVVSRELQKGVAENVVSQSFMVEASPKGVPGTVVSGTLSPKVAVISLSVILSVVINKVPVISLNR